MSLRISSVIYFYMFICAALLVFNILYIFRTKGKNRIQLRQIAYWERMLFDVWNELDRTGRVPEEHLRRLERRLRKIDQLMAYHDAISLHLDKEMTRFYLSQCDGAFLVLAEAYRRRPAMERAFLAYVVAQCCTGPGDHQPLAEILLGYLENSTVYCRENVLRALYAMASESGVQRAFQWLSDQSIYHNTKLLADGLATFNGDREALAWRLWSCCPGWSESVQVAVVEFATRLSDCFSSAFQTSLEDGKTPLEVRFALCRYFQRHRAEEVQPFLLACAGEADAAGDGLAVAACAALSRYPGEKTMATLKKALHSRNWYVRKNAAQSLVFLGIRADEVEDIHRQGDRYASEILDYMLQREKRKETVA